MSPDDLKISSLKIFLTIRGQRDPRRAAHATWPDGYARNPATAEPFRAGGRVAIYLQYRRPLLQRGVMIRKWANRLRYSTRYVKLHDMLFWQPKEQTLDKAMMYARWGRLTGDYLEFGVYNGWSMSTAYHFAQLHRMPRMRFFGFDSFEGLPDINGVDVGPFQQFLKGQLRCDQATTARKMRRWGADMSKVHLISGWYNDTLKPALRDELDLKKAAMVHIDCDLYESTAPVLDFILPLLQDGTIIILDDWYLYRANPRQGERRAFTEWVERHDDIIEATPFPCATWHEAAFIMHLRNQ
ncbi:TylF/MycF/NovP-related O-methyltransferase [Nonomuraea insulae]|uniref:TylF/MycF/NovP-related O-methyltransferase n=1 Tax=Nonomuraea insulae TaxID=1616787 RepID=A0ABW1DA35_9ACTN